MTVVGKMLVTVHVAFSEAAVIFVYLCCTEDHFALRSSLVCMCVLFDIVLFDMINLIDMP